MFLSYEVVSCTLTQEGEYNGENISAFKIIDSSCDFEEAKKKKKYKSEDIMSSLKASIDDKYVAVFKSNFVYKSIGLVWCTGQSLPFPLLRSLYTLTHLNIMELKWQCQDANPVDLGCNICAALFPMLGLSRFSSSLP